MRGPSQGEGGAGARPGSKQSDTSPAASGLPRRKDRNWSSSSSRRMKTILGGCRRPWTMALIWSAIRCIPRVTFSLRHIAGGVGAPKAERPKLVLRFVPQNENHPRRLQTSLDHGTHLVRDPLHPAGHVLPRCTNRPQVEYESDRGASNHSLSDGVRSVDPATTRVPARFPDPALGATERPSIVIETSQCSGISSSVRRPLAG